MSKSYTELMQYTTFEDRIRYLLCNSLPGYETFGPDRIFNQIFYASRDWKIVHRDIAIRDHGCDLAIPDQEIIGEPIIIHHINPITMDDINELNDKLFDPENLITTRASTHRIIHYGYERKQPLVYAERHPGDTCLWKAR